MIIKEKLLIITSFYLIYLILIPLSRISYSSNINTGYEVFSVAPITNQKILPQDVSLRLPTAQEIGLTACGGEYKPASFVIRTHKELEKLVVSATELRGAGGVIPARAVDLRVVKCWFQAGRLLHVPHGKQYLLTPELLLKDDKLVKVDLVEKKNYLRVSGPLEPEKFVLISGPDSAALKDVRPWDAETLGPVDLEAGMVKQFWVTLHVPADAAPGLYLGKIQLTAANAPSTEISLRLRVLPFALEKPALRYSIYYRGKLSRYGAAYHANAMKDGQPAITAEWKTPQQYLAEMVNLKAHGVEYPTVYQNDEQLLRQELALREQAGLPKGTLYLNCIGPGAGQTPAQLEETKRRVHKWIQFARQQGYDEVYFYGRDEAKGELLLAQRPAWQATREAGGKIFAASWSPGIFKEMGDLLNLAVWMGPLDPKEAARYHAIGHQIFSYNNPQVGVEEPETYRRNFGLLLWKANYDGAMDYAYQHGFGHIWNDYDDKQWRDHVFAYPTLDGVIDTIQWEGFREGVDDVRYVTTLEKAIEQTRSVKPRLAAQAQEFLTRLDPQGNLEALRGQTIDWILKLRE